MINQDFDGFQLLEATAYREAERIHKTPIKDIFYEADKNHGVHHQIKPQKIEKLEVLKQIRNIFTHGDGTITERYLKKVRYSDYKLGEKFKLSVQMVDYYLRLAFDIIMKFDKVLVKKYPDFKA